MMKLFFVADKKWKKNSTCCDCHAVDYIKRENYKEGSDCEIKPQQFEPIATTQIFWCKDAIDKGKGLAKELCSFFWKQLQENSFTAEA